MLRYAVKRIAQLIPLLFLVSVVVFLMVRIIPGDPVALLMGEGMPADTMEYERERLGLNDPLYVQYVRYIRDIFQGNLGESIRTGESVAEALSERFPRTLALAAGGTLLGSAIGILMGIAAAVHHNRMTDNVISVTSLLAVSTPSFFLSFILLLIFCVNLKWLPSLGLQSFRHAILPIVVLGTHAVGFISRTTRSSMLDVINQDYIRTSRSRGVPKRVIVYSHALKNALIPVLTAVGLRFGSLLAGAALVESVFSIPGVGKYLVDAVGNRDYPVIQSTILLLATMFVVVNTVIDLLYAVVDPRLKYD